MGIADGGGLLGGLGFVDVPQRHRAAHRGPDCADAGPMLEALPVMITAVSGVPSEGERSCVLMGELLFGESRRGMPCVQSRIHHERKAPIPVGSGANPSTA